DHLEPGNLAIDLRQVRIVPPAWRNGVLADDLSRRTAARHQDQGGRAVPADATMGSHQGIWRFSERSGADARANRTVGRLDSERCTARKQPPGVAPGAAFHGTGG